ncbi:MAG: protein translocase subunit SecF [Maricaulaceae bacterium]|nr:protein translocase subunit SecF [Maricaulaceae bacterium]
MPFALVKALPDETAIPFLKVRMVGYILSALLVLGSIGAFFGMGLNFGIDFRGGVLVEITTDGPADLAQIRAISNSLNIGSVQVQDFGAEDRVMIRVPLQEGVGLEAEMAQQIARQQLQAALDAEIGGITYERVEVVGGAVSRELVMAGTLAVVIALVLMLIYIWFRFEWQYSIGAVVALTHDVIVTIGMFAVLQLEFNLPSIAALLTIVGYSMNDTVVVYDRIRENLRKYKRMSLEDLLNLSLNHTLSRTLLTSLTTLVALVALWLIGGPALEGFAFAMIFGVVIGTYSSIFVATPFLLLTNVRRDEAKD